MSAVMEYREPTEAQRMAVASSILEHIRKNANVAHEVASELLANGLPSNFGELWVSGDLLEAATVLKKEADAKLAEMAAELADSWFVDDFTTHEKKILADWRGVRFASLGQHRLLGEMMP